jgi:hypothetical protein
MTRISSDPIGCAPSKASSESLTPHSDHLAWTLLLSIAATALIGGPGFAEL